MYDSLKYQFQVTLIVAVLLIVISLSFRQDVPKYFYETKGVSVDPFDLFSVRRKTNGNTPSKSKKQVKHVDQLESLHQGVKSVVNFNNTRLHWKKEYHEEELLTLPFPQTKLSATMLLRQEWVENLRQIVSEISPNSPPVYLIVANYKYREVVLNWLITATIRVSPPITNIIILAIDTELCGLLNERKIRCIYVDSKSVINPAVNIAPPQKKTFRLILTLRLTAVRLLNYWGYDAANIDTDAIILKNPETLYQEFKNSDLLAGRGTYPFEVGNKWNATICGGTFMIRSNANSEKYWSTISRMTVRVDDQVLLNYALLAMHPVWREISSRHAHDKLKVGTTPSGFTVTLFPEDIICRNHCSEKLLSQYYIWHRRSHKDIASKSSNTTLWFLKVDWAYHNTSNATGEQWLKEISDL